MESKSGTRSSYSKSQFSSSFPAPRGSPIPEDPNESLSDEQIQFEKKSFASDPAPSPTPPTDLHSPAANFSSFEAGVDAICINCLDYVSYTDIDSHSLMCLSVVCDPATPEEDIDVRLKKLHRGVTRRLKTANKELLMAMMRLRELATEGVRGDREGLARVEMELEELATGSLSVEGGISCSIYARRLLVLISEKIAILSRLIDPEITPAVQQKELLRWQSQVLVLDSLNRGLEDVSSDINSETRSFYSRVSEASSCYNGDMDVGDLEAAEEALKQVSEEQLKKYFYSVCLKQKLILPKHHPKQKFLISKLYEEALRQDVPVSKWEKFIIDSLIGG